MSENPLNPTPNAPFHGEVKQPEVEQPTTGVPATKPVVPAAQVKPPVQQQTQASKPYAFNEANFETKVNKLKALRDAETGKHNKNSHLWYNKNVAPLTKDYNIGVRTSQLFQALMDIKEEVPLINPKLTTDTTPKKA